MGNIMKRAEKFQIIKKEKSPGIKEDETQKWIQMIKPIPRKLPSKNNKPVRKKPVNNPRIKE